MYKKCIHKKSFNYSLYNLKYKTNERVSWTLKQTQPCHNDTPSYALKLLKFSKNQVKAPLLLSERLMAYMFIKLRL